VARLSAEDGFVPFAVRDVFGAPEAVEPALEAFCRATLGAGIEQAEFFEASVGSVAGLMLAGGRRVVVKAHPPEASTRFLEAVQEVQRHLVRGGFPCPEPLAGPAPLGLGVAIVETLIDDGEWPDGHDPAVRRALAAALAELIARCRGLRDLPGLAEHAMTVPAGQLWPRPHDRRFDFEGTAGGAEWIDALARTAAELRDGEAGEPVVAHSDWRVQHVRMAEGILSAVYDWDSLMVMSEAQAVGSAAHAFTMNWATGDIRLPSLEEGQAFVADYEDARGTPFTAAERRAVNGALVYVMAYTARCEHSDALTDMGRRAPAPASATIPAGSARAFIAAHGAELLG
jgi:hypothetical protein